MSPFDYINAVTYTKEDLLKKDTLAPKEYKKHAFIINRGLSYFLDTVAYANVMNQYSQIPPDWQFSFYLNSIVKKKRFSKWNEKEKFGKHFSMVKEYFKYSDEKAKVAMSILTDDQLKEIEEKLYKGGKS